MATDSIATVQQLADALNRVINQGGADKPVRVVDGHLDEYTIEDVYLDDGLANLGDEDDEDGVEGVAIRIEQPVGY